MWDLRYCPLKPLKSRKRSLYQIDLSSIGTVSPSEKLLLELLLWIPYRLNGTFCTLATQTPLLKKRPRPRFNQKLSSKSAQSRFTPRVKNCWFRRRGEGRGWELADPKGWPLYWPAKIGKPNRLEVIAGFGFGVSVGITNFSWRGEMQQIINNLENKRTKN